MRLDDERVRRIEEEPKQARRDYFTVRRYRKKALRVATKTLVDLAKVLADTGNLHPRHAADRRTGIPTTPTRTASYFDPGWTSGLCLAGDEDSGVFDIVGR